MRKKNICLNNPAKIFAVFLFIISIGFSTLNFAADPPPLAMLKNTSNQMIAELDKHLGHIKNNEPLVSSIVRRILLPRVDVTNMSKNVVGRLYWQPTSPALRRQFIKEFTSYVIRTYSTALSSYDGDKIVFYPIRGYSPNQTRVQINSVINRKEYPAIKIQYRVVNRNNNWLVYDFSVDGVSFVRNYRSQFAGTLQQGGLSLLVKKLIEKNR